MYAPESKRFFTFRGSGYTGFRRRRLGPISVLVTEWSIRNDSIRRISTSYFATFETIFPQSESLSVASVVSSLSYTTGKFDTVYQDLCKNDGPFCSSIRGSPNFELISRALDRFERLFTPPLGRAVGLATALYYQLIAK